MKIVSIYDFFQKFPDEEAARLYLERRDGMAQLSVLIVEAIKFPNAKS